MTVSVCDLFSIGVGPSSSHTVGPMRAGAAFAAMLHARRAASGAPEQDATTGSGTLADGAVTRGTGITVILYGSLAATGVGHGTLGACLAGLDGADPTTVDPDEMARRLDEIRRTRTITLAGDPDMPVTCGFEDIILRPAVRRTIHTNAVTFSALGPDGVEVKEDLLLGRRRVHPHRGRGTGRRRAHRGRVVPVGGGTGRPGAPGRRRGRGATGL
jgi:L-serine dehydratase